MFGASDNIPILLTTLLFSVFLNSSTILSQILNQNPVSLSQRQQSSTLSRAMTPYQAPNLLADKPQTKLYVGKIPPARDNEFMRSLLQVCGAVKSWKRPQDPFTLAFKGFGFCEFESAEGLLRALRLLNKISIDGQQLMLNIDGVTRKYLEHYVEKKTENAKKLKETEDVGIPEIKGPIEPYKAANFGIVTDEDNEADREAFEKLTSMIDEGLKTNHPLPSSSKTKVYVGKIAPTVDNDFILAVLQVCGPVKSWKRAQNPSTLLLKGFGFCEFESAEGVFRALRLLNKFNIDGQELVLCTDQETTKYLKHYIEKKTENTKKLKETQYVGRAEMNEPVKPPEAAKFGIVTDEDKEADQAAFEKLTSMIEERLKTNYSHP